MYISEQSHESNNMPRTPSTIAWCDKLCDAAIAHVEAAWRGPACLVNRPNNDPARPTWFRSIWLPIMSSLCSGFTCIVVYLLTYIMRLHDYINIRLTKASRPLVPGVRVERIKIRSRDEGRYIDAIKYSPANASAPLPVHLSWHASGWLLKRLGLDSFMHATFAKRLNAIVLDCDYRKGPEEKYPTAQNDCEDAVAHVLSYPQKYDVNRLTLGGSSAGGCMALVTAAKFGPKIKGVFSLYPVTEMVPIDQIAAKKVSPNKKYNSGVYLVPWMFKVFIRAYANSEDEFKQPRFSPYYGDVSKLPNHILLACGDADTLYHDSRMLYEKIQREGSVAQKRGTEFLTIPNESHEFNNMPKTPETIAWRDKLYDAAIAMIQAAWSDNSL